MEIVRRAQKLACDEVRAETEASRAALCPSLDGMSSKKSPYEAHMLYRMEVVGLIMGIRDEVRAVSAVEGGGEGAWDWGVWAWNLYRCLPEPMQGMERRRQREQVGWVSSH